MFFGIILVAVAVVVLGVAVDIWRQRNRELAMTLERRARTAAAIGLVLLSVYALWQCTHPPTMTGLERNQV